MIPDSSAQQSFLRKHKKRQQFIRLMRLAVFLVFLLLWEVSARLGFIDSFIFGSPGQVCLAFRTLLLTNHLLSHIGITVFETLVSFFLVVGFSLFFSVLLWLCPRLAAILEPYLVVLNSLPKIKESISPSRALISQTIRKTRKTAIRIRRINCCLFLCFCKKERCADESGIMV